MSGEYFLRQSQATIQKSQQLKEAELEPSYHVCFPKTHFFHDVFLFLHFRKRLTESTALGRIRVQALQARRQDSSSLLQLLLCLQKLS